jgi:hypothetical protein
MNTDAMIAIGMAVLKQKIEAFGTREEIGASTADLAEAMSKTLREGIALVGAAMYKTFIESYEETQDVIRVNGELYRFKREIPKEYETFFGKMVLTRRVWGFFASDLKRSTISRFKIPADSHGSRNKEGLPLDSDHVFRGRPS